MEADLLYRNCRIEAESQIDPETRTVELSFSSETPVERSFGSEVLDHEPDSVDLQRINNAAPLLLEHDRSQQIGVVERAWIDEDEKKGRAIVRFSRSALADEIFNRAGDQGLEGGMRWRDFGHYMDRWHDRRATSDAAAGNVDLDGREDRSGD